MDLGRQNPVRLEWMGELRLRSYPEVYMNPDENNEKPSSNSSVDLLPALPASVVSNTGSQNREYTVEDYRNALRMLVGAALEGNDELLDRVIQWREAVQKRELEEGAYYEIEQGGSPLLYTVLGLMFKTPDYIYRGVAATDRITSRAAKLTSKLFRPITHSRFMRPVNRRYDGLVARGESVVNALEDRGRYEAHASRTLVHQEVNDERVEDLMTYMVEKSKMRELITEASTDMGSDALTEIRGRSATVDGSLDNIIDKIFRRQKRPAPPSDSSS
jgi:hypothetical protein